MRTLRIVLLLLAVSLTASSCFVVVDHDRGHHGYRHHRGWYQGG
jgi:uncharacterized protein YceK